MTTNNHPANGPVSLERLHQIRQYIERNNQYQNGGNRAYILADMLKVIDLAIASFGAEPALYAAEETLAYAKSGELHLKCLSQPMGDAVIPLYTAQPAPVMPAELHPDTQNLVANFSTALAEKLYKAQLKYGYDADWKQDGWHTQCLSHFHQHIAKGDPRDVAAYCAFMWYHGWKTESVSGPVVPDDGRAEFEAWMLKKWGRERQEYDFAMGKFLHGENYADSYTRHMWKAWTESRAALLQSKYRDLSQPVDPQISEYEKIMLRAGWVMVPIEPTDEMIAAAMNCEDVVFDSQYADAFRIQYWEIYCAMVTAAPKPEENNK